MRIQEEWVMEMGRTLLENIVLHARECYPFECCGMLLGSVRGEKTVTEVVRIENSDTRIGRGRDRYRIDGRDFLKVDRMAAGKGLEVVGFYHSHPRSSGVPSGTDRSLAWPGYSYLIVPMRDGSVLKCRSWVLDQNGTGWTEERIGAAVSEEGTGA